MIMHEPLIIVVTGASGAGKTTLVRALEARRPPGVGCYYFDSVGVPTREQMTAQFGSPGGWQEAMTYQWIARLKENADRHEVLVLDGQVRPSVVRSAFTRYRVARGRILLIDCGHDVREARLTSERNQPELVTRDMAAWAGYLRGQADALGLPALDTTRLTIAEATDALQSLITAGAPTDEEQFH
jgi:adenylate kinase family enzyme